MGSIKGVIKVDETFFRESLKSNHKKTTFATTCNPLKRGAKGSKSSMNYLNENLYIS